MASEACERACELQAVRAIFPELIDDASTEDCVVINCDGRLRVRILQAANKSKFELVAPSLDASAKKKLIKKLTTVTENYCDMPKLYAYVETIANFAGNEFDKKGADKDMGFSNGSQASISSSLLSDNIKRDYRKTSQMERGIVLHSGRVLEDRKSVFQAHVALISSREEAIQALLQLKENSKIARATHNIYAYRVQKRLSDGRVVEQQDCECDGETGAGPKLLKLLHLMKAINMIVVVTRWYGGIHLGPDRFRHITNLAREVVLHGQELTNESV